MISKSTVSAEPRTLGQWPVGLPGRILRVDPPESDMVRLKAMGLCEGRIVTLLRKGNPFVVIVYRTRIALSAELANRIKVVSCQPLPPVS